MLSVFFILFFWAWSGVFCSFFGRSSLLRVVFLKKFSGANFCFLGVGVGFVFLVGFCLCCCFIFGGSLPKVSGKNSIDVRSAVFWVRSLFLRFFRRRRFFKRYRSGGNRTPPHAPFCWSLFSFCVLPRFLFRPFWPCVLLLGLFSGCHFGPRAFLGFSWYLL